MTVSLEHNKASVKLSDYGHGEVTGTFISPNILSVPGRTVQDGPTGSSVLSATDLFFTTDCSTFTGRYTWDYSDPYGSCSGSTTLNGRNTKAGCPASTVPVVIPPVNPPSGASVAAEISAVRPDLNTVLEARRLRDKQQAYALELEFDKSGVDNSAMIKLENKWIADETKKIDAAEPALEAKYKAILEKDPANFWANWDMAELKKTQGNYNDYITYFDSAASNKNVISDAGPVLKQKVAEDLGLSHFPTPESSPMMQRVRDEAKTRQNGQIYNVDVPSKAKADDEVWKIEFSTALSSKLFNHINEVATPK
ncbi:Uncharacterised protein [Candidatus Gugararchaeum adminiculabundum]|nr:Uncharacterised protein [Candidatus Gugararchaeum adminiculabundum]